MQMKRSLIDSLMSIKAKPVSRYGGLARRLRVSPVPL